MLTIVGQTAGPIGLDFFWTLMGGPPASLFYSTFSFIPAFRPSAVFPHKLKLFPSIELNKKNVESTNIIRIFVKIITF